MSIIIKYFIHAKKIAGEKGERQAVSLLKETDTKDLLHFRHCDRQVLYPHNTHRKYVQLL